MAIFIEEKNTVNITMISVSRSHQTNVQLAELAKNILNKISPLGQR